MKNIIDIYEGVLSDIEGTLQQGDEFFKNVESEFNQLKRGAINSSWYNKFTRSNYTDYRVGIKAVNLLKYLGDKHNELITIIIDKERYSNKWSISILFHSSNNSTASFNMINIPVASDHLSFRFPKLLKQYIEPIFKDIDSFKKFIDANKNK